MRRPDNDEDNLSLVDSTHYRCRAYSSNICFLLFSLCSALMAAVLNVREALASSPQVPIEALHVP